MSSIGNENLGAALGMNALRASSEVAGVSREKQLQKLTQMRGVTQERLDKVAKEFESVFLAEMLRPALKTATPPEPFGGGYAEEMWQGLMVDEYAKAMVDAGGVGVADAIRAELIRMQEVPQGIPAAGSAAQFIDDSNKSF